MNLLKLSRKRTDNCFCFVRLISSEIWYFITFVYGPFTDNGSIFSCCVCFCVGIFLPGFCEMHYINTFLPMYSLNSISNPLHVFSLLFGGVSNRTQLNYLPFLQKKCQKTNTTHHPEYTIPSKMHCDNSIML